MNRGRSTLARFAAPAAFLAAATVAILIVRSGLENGEAPVQQPAAATTTVATTTAPPATTAPPPTTGTSTDPAGAEFYVIEAGDTLEVVAAEHDTTVEALLALNPDVDPVALAIGDRIRVK